MHHFCSPHDFAGNTDTSRTSWNLSLNSVVLRRKQCDGNSTPLSILMYQPSGPMKYVHLHMTLSYLQVNKMAQPITLLRIREAEYHHKLALETPCPLHARAGDQQTVPT
ncbi:hypothetical protein AV530_014405 [Patagioenas fasciata monilis]|uniref:Uncharacterized protein n=1 Tax=Patagioenas fasciata monilis TaxID=372326 RepID=A0A1V4KBL2_PATFA|nr:hypothetical protein AV530_014405 [Patagioenas fasciata monilis]